MHKKVFASKRNKVSGQFKILLRNIVIYPGQKLRGQKIYN